MLKEDIMNHIEFIRKQAKNFLKDWQTQTKTVESDGYISYHYDWKFYDVGDLFFYFELDDKDEQNYSLGHAQHYIAQMVGFKKWDDLTNASEKELELAEFLLRHFKDAQDLQQWEEVTGAPHITPDNAEELLEQLQEEELFDVVSAEERLAKLVEIENNIKSLSKLLRKLFAQKAQLEEEEAKFQEEQELLNQKYMELSELYEEPKK